MGVGVRGRGGRGVGMRTLRLGDGPVRIGVGMAMPIGGSGVVTVAPADRRGQFALGVVGVAGVVAGGRWMLVPGPPRTRT